VSSTSKGVSFQSSIILYVSGHHQVKLSITVLRFVIVAGFPESLDNILAFLISKLRAGFTGRFKKYSHSDTQSSSEVVTSNLATAS
jgi:hypothetical protein